MKSIKYRARYQEGITDYRHRAKIVHQLRVHLGRKNKYHYAAIYATPDVSKPDVCYGYFTTQAFDKDSFRINLKKLGVKVAEKLNSLALNRMLILDLGRRKHLRYKQFIEGISEVLVDYPVAWKFYP